MGVGTILDTRRAILLATGTDKAEIMEITDGSCSVVLDGQSQTQTYAAGTKFSVPAKSGFTITVGSGICQYICSFIN